MVFLCNSFCEKRIVKTFVWKISVYILWYIVFNILTLVFAEQHFVLRLLSTFIVHLIALSYLFKAKIYKLLLILLLIFGMGICSDFIMFSWLQALVPEITDIELVNQNATSMVMGTLSLLLQAVVTLIIKRIASNLHYDELSTADLIKHGIFPLFSIGIIVGLCLQDDNNKQFKLSLMIIMSSALLLMNIYVFFFLRNEINQKLEQRSHVLLVNHAEEITKLYNQSCLDREEQARSAHEYKNTMFAIEGLLSEGKYQEAEQYVKARNEVFAKVTNVVNTGNSVVNAVFNTKYAEATRKDIIVRFSINDLSDIHIEYTDLVTVLANLLNNSIEACEKCEKGNRIIEVVIKAINKNELMISIKNTYNGVILKRKDHYNTTKNDSLHHGFGLENVKRVVMKLNGYMEVENDADYFKVMVVIKESL
jgi:Signal transduction histidine kinase regulating citrate/malate metabolism